MNTRQIWMPLAGALVLGAVLASSSLLRPSAPKDAESMSVRYHWRNGTVAPPYHYEYDIVFEPGERGRMSLAPGYPSRDKPKVEWTESFDVTPESRQKLLAEMAKHGLFSHKWDAVPSRERPVGGGTESLKVVAEGRTYSTPAFPRTEQQKSDAKALYAAVNALVPQAARARLEAKQKARQEEETKRFEQERRGRD